MPTAADQTAVEALAAMSPARRAAQLFAATIANAGNAATFGGLGAIGDIFRGTDYGTTGGQLSAQVRAASPVADTASKVIGDVGTGKALIGAIPKGVGFARSLLTAAPVVGERAAALGATAVPYSRTAAKVLAPTLGALGIGSFLNNDEAPAAVLPPAVATNPVATALATGAAAPATPISPSDEINKFISARLQAGVTNHDLSAIAGIAQVVPGLTKVQQTNKDKIAGTAAAVTDAQFAADIAAANKLGADNPEYDKAVNKATDNYRVRLATLLGVNPQGLSMQQMIQDQTEGQ